MTKADKQAKGIAALRVEVDALKAAQPKPPKPFTPQPYQQYDPTAGMCMPPSALRAMIAAEPRGFMAGVVRDNRGAPTGPTGAIPRSQQPTSPRPSAGDGTGWGAATPIGPPPGLRYVDQQIDAQDRKDLEARIRQDAELKAAGKMTEQIETMRQQTEALAKLAERKP
jgi:hypothetical protein